jgi:hypothetical protein
MKILLEFSIIEVLNYAVGKVIISFMLSILIIATVRIIPILSKKKCTI